MYICRVWKWWASSGQGQLEFWIDNQMIVPLSCKGANASNKEHAKQCTVITKKKKN